MLNDDEKAIQREVRKFVRDEVSHDFIRALDRDDIKCPREYKVFVFLVKIQPLRHEGTKRRNMKFILLWLGALVAVLFVSLRLSILPIDTESLSH